jgi:hypothetical protein
MRAAFTSFALAAALALSWPAVALECLAANCLGLQNPILIKGPVGTYHPKYKWESNANNLTLDLRQATFLANETKAPDERNPLLVLNGRHTGLWVVGGRVVGQQPRGLTYSEIKREWDGNGLALRGPGGVSTVEGMYIENVEDAISPIEDVTKWVVKDVYAKYIRDNFVENDHLQSGLIENTLVDGTYQFLSNRPGADGGGYQCNGNPSDPNLVVEIRNSLVHIQRMPYDVAPNGEPNNDPIKDGKGAGTAFKWSVCGGRVIVSDTIFVIESISAIGGKTPMGFPPGTYTNVTVVWRGIGKYPQPLPAGVKVTRDLSVWTKARRAWLAAHGM